MAEFERIFKLPNNNSVRDYNDREEYMVVFNSSGDHWRAYNGTPQQLHRLRHTYDKNHYKPNEGGFYISAYFELDDGRPVKLINSFETQIAQPLQGKLPQGTDNVEINMDELRSMYYGCVPAAK
jgi:hypothetical protein